MSIGEVNEINDLQDGENVVNSNMRVNMKEYLGSEDRLAKTDVFINQTGQLT